MMNGGSPCFSLSVCFAASANEVTLFTTPRPYSNIKSLPHSVQILCTSRLMKGARIGGS
jgi:hypothetical protein